MLASLVQTVLDWLGSEAASGSFSVGVGKGHALLGQACFDIMTSAQPAASSVPGAAAAQAAAEGAALLAGGGAGSSAEGAVLAYALRHGVAHLCKSGATPLLEVVVVDFLGLWTKAYAAGGLGCGWVGG